MVQGADDETVMRIRPSRALIASGRVTGQNFVSLEPVWYQPGPAENPFRRPTTSIYEENDMAAETRVGYWYASLIRA